MTTSQTGSDSTPIVLTLFFFWLLLVLILIYLYRRLNRETNDQYTVQQLVYGEGGLRDRVIQGVEVVTSLTARFLPQNHDEEEAIGDIEDGNDEEEYEEREGTCQNETNADEHEEEDKDDSSDDYSSIDLKERVKQNNSTEELKEDEEQKKESKDEEKEDGHKQEEEVKGEERVGLLVNIKPFSGSAIWSEEKTDDSNVTAL
ncbi:acidic leucine-rich nuclear phosphoprotein 32 family member E [Pygocentrus nattereri]|uniref:acidic leucine-rich nuclear phosphoprotein 32 family member E n=1 Tax=Pygocentrus nattereri TaxID=42514 RepID=UPI0008146778|nr:acidic leucine-rich nuclear phosphoprotein 32 family member E [Pygocentrus nattereri]